LRAALVVQADISAGQCGSDRMAAVNAG